MTCARAVRQLLLIAIAVALTACRRSPVPRSGGADVRPFDETSFARALAPTTVLVYVDLSSSVRFEDGLGTLQHLARQVRAGDRIVVYPAGRGAGELRPALDTVVPGTVLDRAVQLAGLEVGKNAARASARQMVLAQTLQEAVEELARSYGRPRETRLIETVCHAGDVARQLALQSSGEAPHVTALLISDGVEASARANLTARVPSAAAAQRFGRQVRASEACHLVAVPLTIRMVGVRHREDTRALIHWWEQTLTALGATVRAGDITTALITPIL